jgi:hypothetical protein
VTANQWAVLAPAFEAAWAAINTGVASLSDDQLKALQRRLAQQVVEIALHRELTDPYAVAVVAVERIRGAPFGRDRKEEQ